MHSALVAVITTKNAFCAMRSNYYNKAVCAGRSDYYENAFCPCAVVIMKMHSALDAVNI